MYRSTWDTLLASKLPNIDGRLEKDVLGWGVVAHGVQNAIKVNNKFNENLSELHQTSIFHNVWRRNGWGSASEYQSNLIGAR